MEKRREEAVGEIVEVQMLLVADAGETVEGQMLLAAAAGEIVEGQMLLAEQCPCAQSFGFPIVAGLPWTPAASQFVAEPRLLPASPLKDIPHFAPACY